MFMLRDLVGRGERRGDVAVRSRRQRRLGDLVGAVAPASDGPVVAAAAGVDEARGDGSEAARRRREHAALADAVVDPAPAQHRFCLSWL